MVKIKYFLILITVITVHSFVFAEEKIKIGVSLPLSGSAAAWGQDMKKVILFANERLANNKYELIFEDDKCQTKDAVTAAKKLIEVDKVKYVTGYACSGTVFPTAPLYVKNKVKVMVLVASADGITELGDNIYRTFPSDKFAAKKLYEHIVKKHKKVAILSEETDYAQEFENSFKAANRGGELELFREAYLTDASDFRTQLLRLKIKQPDAIFLNTQTEQSLISVLKQFRQMDFDIPVYAAYFPGTKVFLDNAGTMGEGIEFVDLPPFNSFATEEGIKLWQDFVKEHGEVQSGDIIIASVYEGFRALHQAISKDIDLNKAKFDGIIGKWDFDSTGQIKQLDFVMKRIEQTKPIVIKPAA